ncbi:MAG TPA: AraC family transcriptional regulator, partial [Candidatus Sulfotelmatobacter sp.]|nr:AraC family transcriptional regulator [Candidatus Sulfotelmatobacter sp.]
VEASAQEPFLAASLRIDPALLAGLLLDMPPPSRAANPPPGLSVQPVPPDLLDPMLRLVRLLDRPDDIAMLAPLAERELLYRLLQSEQGAVLRPIACAGSRLSQISRAIDWIRRHFDQPFRIETVAEVACMSPASLHRHFKAVTTMSPLQFQKRLRLQEARRRLLADAADAMRAGFAVGYESPSQFSREYRRLFGAPPAQDAARLRRASRETEAVAEQQTRYSVG